MYQVLRRYWKRGITVQRLKHLRSQKATEDRSAGQKYRNKSEKINAYKEENQKIKTIDVAKGLPGKEI